MMPHHTANNSQERRVPRLQNPYARKRPRTNPPNTGTVKPQAGDAPSHYYPSSNATLPNPMLARPPTRAVHNHNGMLASNGNGGVSGYSGANTLPPNTDTNPSQDNDGSSSKRDSLDSLDDDGFDWDEAIRASDQAVANSQCSQPSPLQSHGRENNGTVAQNQNRGHANNKKPPLHSNSNNNNNIGTNMASLRPAAWSSTAQSKPSPSSSQSEQLSQQLISKQGKTVPSPAPHQHPFISQLPVELRFHTEVIKPVDDAYKKDLIKHANLAKKLNNGWSLYDHQKKAILKGLLMRRFILALDMGLGKTLIGCVWMRSFQSTYANCKAIVICPVSLKQEWTRTAVETTGLKVAVEETKSKKKKKQQESTINDEQDESTTPMVEIFSWAKVPTSVDSSVDNYVVVCDEAHMIQSMQSGRTRDVLALVKPKKCVGVLLLTGTPMKNGKPCNLFPLLRAVQHPFGKNQRAYETHFCAGRQKQFGRGPQVWDASGSSNLNQLRELVSSHMLHLTKDECLKALPKMTRVHEWIPVSHRQQADYTRALQEMQRAYAMSSAMDTDSHEALLGALNRVRMVGAFAKIEATVEIAKKTLQEEPAVVVFTTFVDVAKSIHSKLESSGWPAELLTGETPAKKRQGMVDNFQRGLSCCFICTFGAGGVGLTLTAARTVILLDRPWTPGDAAQAEDRIRRIGQVHPCKSIWVSSNDVDKQIDQMLESKTQTSNTVLNNGTKTNGLSAPTQKISIFKLVGSMVPKNQPASNPAQGSSSNLSQTSINEYFEQS